MKQITALAMLIILSACAATAPPSIVQKEQITSDTLGCNDPSEIPPNCTELLSIDPLVDD